MAIIPRSPIRAVLPAGVSNINELPISNPTDVHGENMWTRMNGAGLTAVGAPNHASGGHPNAAPAHADMVRLFWGK